MKLTGQSINGKLVLGDYNSAQLRDDLQKNPNARYRIERLSPESKAQRGFLHGAVYPLWAFLNGWDWRNNNILGFLHGEAKKEFNGEMVVFDGKPSKRGKTTKGVLNEYTNKIVDYLEDQYAIDRSKMLNPDEFNK